MFGLLALLIVGNTAAQTSYPEKPIRMVVGFPPGGAPDTVARLLGQKLSEALRQPVVMDNATGAGGNIATERVAKAAPDGYTLGFLVNGQLVINPSMYKLAFDPAKDLAPISQVTVTPNMLVVNTAVPAKNLQELISLARAKPGELTFASGGTGTGNHIHVILDDQPYEAYYSLDEPFELKNVTTGKHVVRVFASRPWHESYKNEGSFQMVVFTVKKGGDASQPTTNGAGQTMADNNSNRNDAPTVEIDPTRPLLTYSRPKGEYKGADTEAIMIDFWLGNVKLKGDGGEYRVRYIIDDDEPGYIDRWEPVWLSGWINGKHTVRLELLGPDQYPFKNGDFNITTREISVVK